MTIKNRHPADRLGDARAAMKEAEEAFEVARAEALATLAEWHTERLEGDDYIIDFEQKKWRGRYDFDKMLKDGIDPETYRMPGRTVPTLTPRRKKRRRPAVRPS